MPNYVPIMLDCEDRVCVVIGGGQVAERKVRELLAGSARVTVISPLVTPNLQEYYDQGKLNWIPRKYAAGDLEGTFMVHAASNDAGVNAAVAAEAKTKGILANVADQPDLGSFIHPSVLRRGRLLIAVSTSGAGPLAARAIRRKLDEDYGTEYEEYLDALYHIRKAIQQQVNNPAVRQKLLRKASGPEMFETLRQGTSRPWSPEDIRQWINDNQEE
ncbi:bifunctional precorrin-2 dehydrogenase/sirohydrochlorin ferrochelatase [Paenibacillus sp. HJL G12]|uniref:precorrin-2 dehydrogenase n=1 Tax=Paenibacillus dendrobii TaxID=2691084 RepID=A0A7X3IML3_9BACL|nr:bifunctional precorrin-2 dehydrogenase/sirohydrochlorin ferrochelatase [Paenibacillus dendrobii]MWV46739.1 bifunctional precorrin-2 dehydrogenase/sirohydrochlorin ferrochelatase [Paenibacillus dendrobii]